MRTETKAILATIALSLPSAAAHAATINVDQEVGQAMESEFGMSSGTSTHGRHLGGMLLTATYSDGTSEDLVWNAYSGHGDVTGSGLYMSFTWDYFRLTTTKFLTTLSMDAAPANAIFDTLFLGEGDVGNTPGTSYGFTYRMRDGDELGGDISVTYSNQMSIKGADAQGDAYTKMRIDYTGLDGGGLLGYTGFSTDLDSIMVAGDLNPVGISEVPLPAGLPLLLAGLGLLGLQRRKAN